MNSNDFLLTIVLKQNFNEATYSTQLIKTKTFSLRVSRHLVFAAASFQRTGLPSFEGSYTATLVDDLNKFKTSLALLWFKNILKNASQKTLQYQAKKEAITRKTGKETCEKPG